MATKRSRRVLSICTGMGLLDRAFIDAGFEVVAGCEIDQQKRAMYRELCGGDPLVHDLEDLPAAVKGQHFAGIIGGPPCQSHSRMRAMRDPKYVDLTPFVNKLLAAVRCDWFLLENVTAIDLKVPHVATRCNAMHYYQPHQSRVRWFTHSPEVLPPKAVYSGDADDLLAYCAVIGRLYGPKRGAKLQGYPDAAKLPFLCDQLQHGLADAVPYPLALSWARSVSKLK